MKAFSSEALSRSRGESTFFTITLALGQIFLPSLMDWHHKGGTMKIAGLGFWVAGGMKLS